MQRWLKRITPDRHTLEKLWCLRPFKAIVLDRGRLVLEASSASLLKDGAPLERYLGVGRV